MWCRAQPDFYSATCLRIGRPGCIQRNRSDMNEEEDAAFSRLSRSFALAIGLARRPKRPQNRYLDGALERFPCNGENPSPMLGIATASSTICIEIAARSAVLRIGVAKSSSHQLSQNDIGSDNPCSQHLSESQSPVRAFIRTWPSCSELGDSPNRKFHYFNSFDPFSTLAQAQPFCRNG